MTHLFQFWERVKRDDRFLNEVINILQWLWSEGQLKVLRVQFPDEAVEHYGHSPARYPRHLDLPLRL